MENAIVTVHSDNLPALRGGASFYTPPEYSQYRTREELLTGWINHQTSAQTRRAYRFELGRFLAFLAGALLPFEHVRTPHIERYIQSLGTMSVDEKGVKTPPLSAAAQARATSALKSLYRHAEESKYMAYNPASLVKVPKVKNASAQRQLSKSVQDEMIDGTTCPLERAILLVGFYGGLRVSEICNLRWSDVIQNAGAGPGDCPAQLYILGKGEKERWVPIHRRAYEALQAVRPADAAPDAYVFAGPRGGRYDTVRAFRIVREAAKRIGLSGNVSPHWMRHTFATLAYQNGAPLEVISKALGHSSVSVTAKVYVHFDNTKPASAYLK